MKRELLNSFVETLSIDQYQYYYQNYDRIMNQELPLQLLETMVPVYQLIKDNDMIRYIIRNE